MVSKGEIQSWINDVRRATNPLHTATLSTKETPVMRTVLLGLDGRRRRRNLFDTLSSTTTTPLSVTVPSSASTSTITSPSPFPSLSTLIPYYHMMFPHLTSYPTTSSTMPPVTTCGPPVPILILYLSLPSHQIPPPLLPPTIDLDDILPWIPHRHHSSPPSRVRSRSPSRESQTESDLVELSFSLKKNFVITDHYCYQPLLPFF